jgi:hypothetical protein
MDGKEVTRIPGFSAEASLYRNRAHYRVGPMSAGLGKGGKAIIHPALPMVPTFQCEDPFLGTMNCSLCGGDPDEGELWCLYFEADV